MLLRLAASTQQQVSQLPCIVISCFVSSAVNHYLCLFVCLFAFNPECTQTIFGYECRCQQPYVWPHHMCLFYGACDRIAADTCGCIRGLPAEGQLCQPNGSQPGRFRLFFSADRQLKSSVVCDVLPCSCFDCNFVIARCFVFAAICLGLHLNRTSPGYKKGLK